MTPLCLRALTWWHEGQNLNIHIFFMDILSLLLKNKNFSSSVKWFKKKLAESKFIFANNEDQHMFKMVRIHCATPPEHIFIYVKESFMTSSSWWVVHPKSFSLCVIHSSWCNFTSATLCMPYHPPYSKKEWLLQESSSWIS